VTTSTNYVLLLGLFDNYVQTAEIIKCKWWCTQNYK